MLARQAERGAADARGVRSATRATPTNTLAQIAEATELSIKTIWKASRQNESVTQETAETILAIDTTLIPRRVSLKGCQARLVGFGTEALLDGGLVEIHVGRGVWQTVTA